MGKLIKVSVKLFLTLREIVGEKVIDMELPERSTVIDLANSMARKYGRAFSKYAFDEKHQIQEFLNFLVNGKNIKYLDGLKTTLNDGDSITILPPAAGG